MEDLVTYLARRLVDDPDAVRVDSETDGETVRLKLTVASGDVGKVIGRQGRIVRAMRVIIRSGGARRGQRCLLEIVE